MRQVNALADVPYELRKHAKCFRSSQDTYLAKPQDIELQGSIRREQISSPVGTIHMRWPRKVETQFGRTPLRAMTDVANTVSKALRRASFPSRLQSLNLEWQVIFLDAELPETQIPAYLIANCHPGWMTPPANIYIVAQRVTGGCSNTRVPERVADKELAEVLVHEMGHAIEYHLLEGTNGGDRMRAEGFATWFEGYASDFSSLLNSRNIIDEQKRRAKASIQQSQGYFAFKGSAEDYARAAMNFYAISSRRGVSSLIDVYERMVRDNVGFMVAVDKELDWDAERLAEEIGKFLGAR
ncbi:MAG: hypothetical protein IT290_04265 [Deltaproteobacteria bacterium]|nr:hypothetical protein [Deltaproteobacteria bacterium]